MLTLTRKLGEVIYIGDNIVVEVKEVRRNQVRLGIVAPENVLIFRGELCPEKEAEYRDQRAKELANPKPD